MKTLQYFSWTSEQKIDPVLWNNREEQGRQLEKWHVMTSNGHHGISSEFYEWNEVVLVQFSSQQNSERSETRKNLTTQRVTHSSNKNIQEDSWEFNASALRSSQVGPELSSLLTRKPLIFSFMSEKLQENSYSAPWLPEWRLSFILYRQRRRFIKRAHIKWHK